MKDEPAIVKELKQAEKLGLLKSESQGNLDYVEKEECLEDDEDINYFAGGYKDLPDEMGLASLEVNYKTIFENYAIAITLADEKERIVSWNKYAEKLLNMDEKDLFLRNVKTLYPEEEWKKIREKNIRQKGMKYKMETQMIRKNKKPLDVEISLCVLKGLQGKTFGSIGIIKDITKLKNYEKRLIETEEKYKTIFENSAVAIMLLDEKENIVSWNKYTEKLLGYSETDLNLKPIKMLYPSEEWKKIRSENIREKGMQHHLETKIWTKNHELLDVDISISVLKNHKGKIIGSIGIIRDISGRKKIQKELEFKHELLESALNNIPDCIYFKDEEGKFIKVNQAKANRAKTTPEDMIGKTERSFFSEDYAKISMEDEKKVIQTGKSIINKIEKVIDPHGKEYWVSVTKIPRFNKNGRIIGTMGINRDITEIKKSEERYKNLFEKAIDPILVINTKGEIIDLNEQVTTILEYKKKELIGKNFKDLNLIKQDSLKRVLENFAKRMRGEKIPPYEIEVITKNGEIIPAEINASAIYDNKQIVGNLVILRDTRERRTKEKIQKELNASEKKFRDIFNATSDFLIYIENGIILDINDAALKLCSMEKRDTIGKKLSIFKDIFPENDIKKHYRALETSNNGKDVYDYEVELKTPKGILHRFLFSVDCIYNQEEIKGIIMRGKDITQRQREWDELVRLEEKYRVLAETSLDGVITIDALGRLTYINPSFEKMLKRRKSQILATMFRDYLSDDSVYFFQQIFTDSRKKNEKIENVELELVDANANIVQIEINIAPFKKDDKFSGMACTIHDITERKKIENEFKKSERLKTEFMNIAAHELKSPVTPIKGYLDLIISDEEAGDKIKNWAKVSLRNSERLLRLVNDILDVSRLDTDTMNFEMIKLPIIEILDEIAEDMKPAVEGKGLKFITYIPPGLPQIMGDRHRLSQVFKNILVNALKFTDHGSISIIVKKQKENILIKIVDTGIGISKDEEKKVFNKFYQAYTGDDRKNEGTGLGLFICREIIQKHNGTIWVESTLGKGSKFCIKLPYLHQMTINLKKDNKTNV
jgi:PAS domain S-box-containing protein